MPTLPVVTVRRPAILAGQANGRLDPAILHTWQPPWGGQPVTFVEPALRCYVALSTVAYRAGFVLFSVGSYRSYRRQVELFNERYRRVPYETGIWWDGNFWIHESGAQAAIPGTSNHGLGLAIDAGEQLDADPSAESISAAAVDWLIRHEREFGFSHEIQSEPWHLRYWHGDDIPAAVLAFERGDDMSEQAERDITFLAGRVDALAHLRPTVVYGPERGTALPLVAVINRIAEEVGIGADELAAIAEAARQGAEIGASNALADLSAQEIAEAISNEVAGDVLDLLRARLEN